MIGVNDSHLSPTPFYLQPPVVVVPKNEEADPDNAIMEIDFI
jgi:hypothetical protein